MSLPPRHCEYRRPMGDDHSGGYIRGEACGTTLDVRKYQGKVLCRCHRLVYQLLNRSCSFCGNELVVREDDALREVEHAYADFDPDPHPMTLSDVLDCMSWSGVYGTDGRTCDYCAHMLSKDD